MYSIKCNKKKLNSLENKMKKISKSIAKSTMEGVQEALKNTQTLAIRIRKGESSGILTELVEINSNKVKGRVYTDKVNFFWATFLEYGTGEYAQLPHIGTTPTFIKSGYEYWFIPVSKVDKRLYYPIIEIQEQQFYIAHGVQPKPFMTPAGIQTREQNVEIIKKAIKSMIREVCK